MSDINPGPNKPSIIPGLTIVGCLIVGIAGLFGALYGVDRHDANGVGACLLASAVAFGLGANAVFRK